MKKFFLFVLTLGLLSFNLFSEKYQISNINYDIQKSSISLSGKTQIYALEQNVSIDKSRIFDSIEELDIYITEYKQKLENTRCFEEIQINYETNSNSQFSDEIISIDLNVYLKDSNHFLLVPHIISYNSNSGWNPKLKVKDMNFLGSLNELSADIYTILPIASDSTSKEIGSTFKYDYPFKFKMFDSKWVNDYTISYRSGDTSPEWNLKTGLALSYPINKYAISFEVYQSAIRNFDYSSYGDSIYYNENATVSFPIILKTFDFLGNFTYKPYLNTSINWDLDGIDPNNSSLSSPVFAFGQSLSASRVDWINNFRAGLGFTFSNSYSYNLQRHIFYPYISGEIKYFYNYTFWETPILNEIGVSSRIFAYHHFVDSNNPYFSSDGTAFGARLRGIRDEQYFVGTGMKACTSISAVVMNFDFPIRFYQTDFRHKLFNYFNVDLILQPFVDIALCHNKFTGKYYDPKDGFYAAGFEGLIYPKKWSSFTVRASLGFDIGKLFLEDYLNNEWRAESSPFEISFGIGLQY